MLKRIYNNLKIIMQYIIIDRLKNKSAAANYSAPTNKSDKN